ncbi:hypothetical protein RCH18_000676 [Flavobacterium sp. PL11]|uniref:hypothetical protein n=1 Tax=Flavobacterium sp. PL11 TaxID=3071717 RepID=UPI002DFB63C1|nr:hypothetical protein [Flavobacterium sp. PL11]
MKVKLLVFLFFIVIHTTYSQTEQLINGSILCEQLPLTKVEIANYNSKHVVLTNEFGAFSIFAKTGDELIFISRNHDIKKITVSQKTIETNNLIVYLTLKPEELNEVIVTKIPSIKLSKDAKWEEGKLDEMALDKAASKPKVLGVYAGGIENGMNLMRIGGMIIKLFKKEKDVIKKELPQIDFKTLARSSCDNKFFLETLHLKREQIDLFLQFCDADPKSKLITENANVLSVMDFLTTKNVEFKKL